MKKVLFATTALIATGSVAAADVSFGGWGRFGIKYDESTGDTNLTHRFRLQVDVVEETDNGVQVGARVRFQTDASAAGGGDTAVMGSPRFFLRSGGLELGVGNIFGALDAMPGMYPIDIGLTGNSYDYSAAGVGGFDAFDSTGAGTANGVEVMYSAGDLGVHVSYSDNNDRLAAHISYAVSGWTLALGLQDSNSAADTELALSAGGSFGMADVTLAYAETGAGVGRTVLAGRFDVGAATNVEVYVSDEDGAASTAYGIDFNHDLGGGVSLRGGIDSAHDGDTTADFGVRFNF